MIWLTWRQFRAQALTALVALVAVAIYLAVLGLRIRDSYDTDIVGCQATQSCPAARAALENQYSVPILLITLGLIVAPVIIGIFWGAPLITRELEAGTHRLVWSQSVVPARWLAVKLALVALASALITGLFSLMLTWAAAPYDDVHGDRFNVLFFGARNIVPIGYAVFAVVVGIALGLVVRRTVTAMALTLAAVAAVQIMVPFVVRPHALPPLTSTLNADAAAFQGTGVMFHRGSPLTASIGDYEVPSDPGAWVLNFDSTLLNPDGKAAGNQQLQSCSQVPFDKIKTCLAGQKLQFDVVYQPGSRYWTFQLLELSAYLVLAAGVAALSIRRVRSPLV